MNAQRAILADDLGMGKTATVIRACAEVEAKNILVVAKKSLITNWLSEIRRWSPHEVGTTWAVTNYEQVVAHLEDYLACTYDAIVVDEAAYIRNRKAKRSKAIHRLSRKTKYMWLVTGTPVVSGPWDLWSLLRALYPSRYTSFWRFADQHFHLDRGRFGIEIGAVKDSDALAKEVAPIMIRRTKELLNLPALSFENIYIDLGSAQRKLYKTLCDDLMTQVVGEDGSLNIVVVPSLLALMTRLRQVVCSPALVGGKDVSSKTDALMDLLEELTCTHKVLVFSAFAEYIKLLVPKMASAGYHPQVITGSCSTQQRNDAMYDFWNVDKCRVLIGTTGAMGEGLNMQNADVVIFTDSDWTPAANEQAYSRAYRRGQKKPVHVIKLIARDTVDEYVQRVIDNKERLASVVTHAMRKIYESR